MICGLLKVDSGEGDGDIEDATAEYVLPAGVLLAGDPDEVAKAEVEDAWVEVLLMPIVFDQLELCVAVGFGATRTMLGIELCTINVAVIVECVFGRAFACPVHIPNALSTTDSVNG
jgi:hypothetical protein